MQPRLPELHALLFMSYPILPWPAQHHPCSCPALPSILPPIVLSPRKKIQSTRGRSWPPSLDKKLFEYFEICLKCWSFGVLEFLDFFGVLDYYLPCCRRPCADDLTKSL